MGVLDTIFSASEGLKRRARNVARDPAGALEQASDEIKRRLLTNPTEVALDAFNPPMVGGLAGVVKQKGGNWLTGSIEDALAGLKRSQPARTRRELAIEAALTPEQRADIAKATANPIDSWIDKNLANYVKNEMATPGDPLRALAERGKLHIAPQEAVLHPSIVNAVRSSEGFPIEGVSTNPLARGWEQATDASIDIGTGKYGKEYSINRVTPIMDHDLGFPHLVDELANAINPASGLPAHLQFPADRLNKVSVAQAAERVADINAWRAAQKVEANRALANQAALVREYAENNPKGLKWVQLKKQEGDNLPEGWRRIDATDSYIDANGKAQFKTPSEQALADQLKYEGDTMGHCVGGYCDDVASGRSQIYSLRDAKGEPHVTVEVAPNTRGLREYLQQFEHPEKPGRLSPDELGITDTLYDYVQANRRGNGDLDEFGLETLKRLGHPLPPSSIKQIKGKQNKAPNPEYLPFVQDFVKNPHTGQPWADVGDLQNTGLFKHPAGKYVSDADVDTMANRHFQNQFGNKPDAVESARQYAERMMRYSEDQLSDVDKAFLSDYKAGNFADGGFVKNKYIGKPMDTTTRGNTEDKHWSEYL